MYAGRYQIVTALGQGAMGRVYRALDTTLDVEVALKILRTSSPALVERLLTEVRLARQITHPAICRVYDVDHVGDEYFFTMELVDGEDLKSLLSRIGRLPGEKVREIGVQICEGLAAAHDRGVLHRDLKPSNIMLDGSGAIRITDFGVATSTHRTAYEPLAGTPDYMAPELIAGEPATVQSDLYAVGLVLYEALVGSLPKPNAADGSASSRDERFPKPSATLPFVDPRLERVVLSLLSDDPRERPQSAAAAAAALVALGPLGPGATKKPRRAALAATVAVSAACVIAWLYFRSAKPETPPLPPTTELLSDIARPPGARQAVTVAVLPVTDASAAKDRGEIAECLQDDLIDRLSSVAGVEVIGEDSADRATGTGDAEAIGRMLGASFVAVGSVREGERGGVRLTVDLFDTRDGNRLWSESYDNGTAPREMFDTEQRIVTRMVATMDPGNGPPTIPERGPPTDDAAAYTLYVRGRGKVPPFTVAEFHSGVAALTQAIERDPRFGEAHAALATDYVIASVLGWIDAATGFASARRYAERAIALDPSLDEPHVVMGTVFAEYEWDWAAAESAFRDAIRLNPSSAWAHRTYARFLSSRGRFDEALAATGRAAELDPTSALMLQGAAQRYYEARRYDRASAIARLAVRLDPLYPYSYVTLGHVLIAQGRYDEAVEQLRKAVDVGGRDATSLARLAYAQALAGDRAGAGSTALEANRLGAPDAAERALLAMVAGDADAAVAALRGAVDRHERPSIWLAVLPLFDPLRRHPEFSRLVERVGGAPALTDRAAADEVR